MRVLPPLRMLRLSFPLSPIPIRRLRWRVLDFIQIWILVRHPEVEAEVPVSSLAFGAAARAVLVAMDSVDLEDEFLTRVCVIQCVPAFLRGLYRASMRFVLIEEDRAREASDTVALLGSCSSSCLVCCFTVLREAATFPSAGFSSGSLILPQVDGPICWRKVGILTTQASVASRRRRRRPQGDDVRRRADRAEALVQMGELSAGRAALEGASLVPGSETTRRALVDESRRPSEPREPLRDDLFQHRGPRFSLDHDIFPKNIRVARRGAAAGPSGMTGDRKFAQDLARACAPDEVVDAIRLGRLTALQKPNGGVRGIVVGDIIRRLVARTIAQQLSSTVKQATARFSTLFRRRLAGSALLLMHSRLSLILILAPPSSPFTESALSTSFHEVRCWNAFAQSQEATLCFLSSFSSTAILHRTYGMTILGTPTKSAKAKEASKVIL